MSLSCCFLTRIHDRKEAESVGRSHSHRLKCSVCAFLYVTGICKAKICLYSSYIVIDFCKRSSASTFKSTFDFSFAFVLLLCSALCVCLIQISIGIFHFIYRNKNLKIKSLIVNKKWVANFLLYYLSFVFDAVFNQMLTIKESMECIHKMCLDI